MFKVSVIIPVYNAAAYLRKAVESAVHLNEVGEVILIEDKSPDNALEICYELANQYDKIVVLQHPNGENRGAGASRNLGINHSMFDYIAFLDADDWYLPNRFSADKIVFESNPLVDVCFSNFTKDMKNLKAYLNYEEYSKWVYDSKNFYGYILNNNVKSPFNTNTITIKKSFLLNNKLFDVRLRLHQDSELFRRLMRTGTFHPSELKVPVCVVRMHPQNRIKTRSNTTILLMLAIAFENIGHPTPLEIDFFYKKIINLQSSSLHYKLIRVPLKHVMYSSLYPVRRWYIKSVLKKSLKKNASIL